jgi:hypothetical protein
MAYLHNGVGNVCFPLQAGLSNVGAALLPTPKLGWCASACGARST